MRRRRCISQHDTTLRAIPRFQHNKNKNPTAIVKTINNFKPKNPHHLPPLRGGGIQNQRKGPSQEEFKLNEHGHLINHAVTRKTQAFTLYVLLLTNETTPENP